MTYCPDIRRPVLWARFRRFLHLLLRVFSASHRAWDVERYAPPSYLSQMLFVGCACGKVFYRDAQFGAREEELTSFGKDMQ